MCRSTDYDRFTSVNRDRLKIRTFVVRFSGLRPAREPLPQSLTLIYLPRIDENELEISGSKIRPDSSAFVTLHRGVSGSDSGSASFGSRDRVVASDGARFEVYLREERVLKGIFRREEGEREWGLELACVMETKIDGVDDSTAVEVGVAAEGHVAVCERVEMKVRRRRTAVRRRLEEIPEEREEGLVECECGGFDCGGGVGSDGGDLKMEMDGGDEMDVEGVGWAVDVGIWVMCLGVGFLVSKASSKTLRRRRIL